MISIRKGATQNTLSVKVDGRIWRRDLKTLEPRQITDLAHALFHWKVNGYKGYPDLRV